MNGFNPAAAVTAIVRTLACEILGPVAERASWTPINGNLGPSCLVRFESQDAAQTFVNAMDADPRMLASMRDGNGGAQVVWIGGSR